MQGKKLLKRLENLPTTTRSSVSIPQIGLILKTLQHQGYITTRQSPREHKAETLRVQHQGLLKHWGAKALNLILPFGDPLGLKSAETHLHWDLKRIAVTPKGKDFLTTSSGPPQGPQLA